MGACIPTAAAIVHPTAHAAVEEGGDDVYVVTVVEFGVGEDVYVEALHGGGGSWLKPPT